MKQKVLFVLPTLHAGGAENYALRFLNFYREQYDFHVLAVNTKKGDLHEQFELAGAKIFYQSIGYFDLAKTLKFRKLLQELKIDTLCTFNGNFGGLPIFIAKTAGVPHRVAFYRRSTNAFGRNRFKLWYNDFVNRLVFKYATRILSNSEFAFQNFHAKHYKTDKRFAVISNGVDLANYELALSKTEAREKLGLPADSYIIGHIGRFDPAKNHETIFKVIQKVGAENPSVRFVFCGKNTDSGSFKSELEKHHIEKYVYTLGLQDDVPLVLKSFDAFYFPSVTEGQPNALIEAMLSGLPALASNIPPILEALPKAAHALMFDPLNVDDVAAKLLSLASNADLAKPYQFREWAASQFDHVKNFELFHQALQHGK